MTTRFARATAVDYQEAAIAKVSQIHTSLPDGRILVFVTGKKEIDEICDALQTAHGSTVDACPLHAKLPLAKQRRAFSAPPPGVRKVVVATDVAETSLTIPDVA